MLQIAKLGNSKLDGHLWDWVFDVGKRNRIGGGMEMLTLWDQDHACMNILFTSWAVETWLVMCFLVFFLLEERGGRRIRIHGRSREN